MEIELGKRMVKESSNTKSYLSKKYQNVNNIEDFLKNTGNGISSKELEIYSEKELKTSIEFVIEAFTQAHKVSFIDRMEEIGLSFSLSAAIFFEFQNDMNNIQWRPFSPKSKGWHLFARQSGGRRWPGPLTIIKGVLNSVVSLINRSKEKETSQNST